MGQTTGLIRCGCKLHYREILSRLAPEPEYVKSILLKNCSLPASIANTGSAPGNNRHAVSDIRTGNLGGIGYRTLRGASGIRRLDIKPATSRGAA